MTEKNEAAERLRRFGGAALSDEQNVERSALVDAALAAERRATVERIWAGSQALMYRAGKNEVIAVDALALVLGEEAAR